jgi:ABC-2 type transport system permease protein
MKALLEPSWILFRSSLGRTVRTKRGLLCLGLAMLPAGLAFLVSVVSRFEGAPPVELLWTIVWLITTQSILPLIALFLGSAAVAEEIEDRTLTFLFTRPMPRPAVLLGRWLAALVPAVILLALSGWLTVGFLESVARPDEASDWMPAGFRLRFVAVLALGCTVYTALFASFGALVKRPVLFGLGYTVVFEGLLANLPGANQKISILYYLKSLLVRGDLDLGELERAFFAFQPAEPGEALWKLLAILATILALGSWRLARREFVLAAD